MNRSIVVLLFFCIVLIGCRRLPPPPDGLPQLYPCKVSVTFGGEAVEGVNVSLVSASPDVKWKSGAKTDQNGVAELRTSFAYPGVPEGEFVIAFDKVEDSQVENARTVEEMTPISKIPLKYGREKSKESIMIKPEKNEFSFSLESGEERLPIPKGIVIPKK